MSVEPDETVTLSALQNLLEFPSRIKQEHLLRYYVEAASDEEFEKLMILIKYARDPNLIPAAGSDREPTYRDPDQNLWDILLWYFLLCLLIVSPILVVGVALWWVL